MFVVRKLLSATEGAPPNTRVNPDTGVVETTPDGVTWVDDPRSDPRQNPAYILPPPAAPDVKCAAAAGMVENVRKVVAAGLAFGTVGGLATALLPLLLIPGIGWMYLAVILFASVLLIALGGGLFAAMTEEVYDQLLCIFYANIGDDGTVTWAQLEAIHAQVGSEIGNALITDFIGGLFQYQREVGVTNAGVAYADPDAECDCEPMWCRMYDFRIDPYGFEIISLGSWVDGVGFVTEWVYDGGADVSFRYVDIANHSFFASVKHLQFAFEYTKGSVTAGGGNTAIGLWDTTFTQRFFDYTLDAIPPVPDSPLIFEDDAGGEGITSLGGQLITGILGETNADPGGSGTMIYVKMCGTGEPPEGGVECDPDDC